MNNFFAYINRMKYISRWGLMQGTQTENDMEHTMQVVLLSHALSAIAKERLGLDPDLEKVVLIAAYHDVSEVITGDLATPVKYANPRIKEAFHDIEDVAVEKLLSMLPEDLKPAFSPYRSSHRHDCVRSMSWQDKRPYPHLQPQTNHLKDHSGNIPILYFCQKLQQRYHY